MAFSKVATESSLPAARTRASTTVPLRSDAKLTSASVYLIRPLLVSGLAIEHSRRSAAGSLCLVHSNFFASSACWTRSA